MTNKIITNIFVTNKNISYVCEKYLLWKHHLFLGELL